ncbi:hypothetical protein ACKGJO_02630 [Gracilimonas sp. Q87]|uniref:hypothetical protein n=1 Tax=Gracilimonas sp. Q87 TaxID=3384766 RepID=UPI003983FE86
MNDKSSLVRIGSLVLLGFLMVSCNSESEGIQPAEEQLNLMAISGMDRINDGSYLSVYDLKSFEEGNRVGIIEVSEDIGINVYPVKVTHWQHEDGAGSDLESVCGLHNRDNEFLIAESGKWDGKFGRMFHLKLTGDSTSYEAQVLGVLDLPEFDAKGPQDNAGDEIEGLACISTQTDNVMVLLGERGGSSAYPNGLIRWAEADLSDYSLNWSEKGRKGVEVNAPGNWVDDKKNRDISALYIDGGNSLWATASEELGDNGPFNSLIYKVGTVQVDDQIPIRLVKNFEVYKTLNGFKAEAITGGTELIPGSVFAIGTEDELLGGSWRVMN